MMDWRQLKLGLRSRIFLACLDWKQELRHGFQLEISAIVFLRVSILFVFAFAATCIDCGRTTI